LEEFCELQLKLLDYIFHRLGVSEITLFCEAKNLYALTLGDDNWLEIILPFSQQQ
jgi:hypothetical protein